MIPYAAALVQADALAMRRRHEPAVSGEFEVFQRKGRTLPPAAQSLLDFIGPSVRAMPGLA